MKLTLVNRTSSDSLLTDTQQSFDMEEVDIADPKATLLNVRATAAIRFKINIKSFWMHFDAAPTTAGDGTATAPRRVDLSNERQLLSQCGLQDGDTVVLYSQKRCREQVQTEYAHYVPEAKRARAEETEVTAPSAQAAAPVAATGAHDDAAPPAVHNDEDDADDAEEDSEDPVTTNKMELYSAFFESVPNLVEFRKQFLADPQASMLKMQKDNPALFQLIAANQEAWLELINDEETIKAIQEDQVEEIDLGDEPDEEMDEAQLAAFNRMLMEAGGAPNEDGEIEIDGESLRALLQGGSEDYEDGSQDGEGSDGEMLQTNSVIGPNVAVEKVLAYVPSDDEEKKIQDLVQLGFTYNQCKVAFYRCLRSVERAANMLFESPPKI
ncbi:hypothetical protein STCU_09020 [Strigomonas culicis]|uniref:UBA domain-containing protein n=1 Tax=Strigomonas culicis TaxID=28005 RepID=S9V0E9_9TRYP|nr:hypothetical protein STCU_09020 [Strigomonas culicis]|eukprot:EPY20381.1 hypothetical protein STCU_09020 [Strigomonas culicis]